MKTRGLVLVLVTTLIAGSVSRAFGAARQPPQPRRRVEIETVLAKAPKQPVDEKLCRLNVVLVADKKDHGPGEHDYPCWQKRWKVLLGGQKDGESSPAQVNLYGPAPAETSKETAAGAPNVHVETAWQWPEQQQFKAADLIVFFCYRSGGPRRTWSDERVKELEAYLSRGGGLVLIHSATYTLRDMSQPAGQKVAALTGLAFDKSIMVRHGPMELKITAADHPICLGLPKTIHFVDEPYWPPVGDLSKVRVLATSDEIAAKGSDRIEPQPMFWTCQAGKGRVYGCVMGHFNWTFDDPYFRILLLRGMAWAAGDSPYRFDRLVLRGAACR